MTTKVIAAKYLPAELPINLTLLLWTMANVFAWKPLAIGIVGTLLTLNWLASIYCVLTQRQVPPTEVGAP